MGWPFDCNGHLVVVARLATITTQDGDYVFFGGAKDTVRQGLAKLAKLPNLDWRSQLARLAILRDGGLPSWRS